MASESTDQERIDEEDALIDELREEYPSRRRAPPEGWTYEEADYIYYELKGYACGQYEYPVALYLGQGEIRLLVKYDVRTEKWILSLDWLSDYYRMEVDTVDEICGAANAIMGLFTQLGPPPEND